MSEHRKVTLPSRDKSERIQKKNANLSDEEKKKKLGPSIVEESNLDDAPADARYVLDEIRKYLLARYDDVREAMGMKGGWEVWLQIELAREIRKSLAGHVGYEILREQLPYINNKAENHKVDLWVARQSTDVKAKGSVNLLELKVAYESTTPTGAAKRNYVKDRMIADMEKIDDARDLKPFFVAKVGDKTRRPMCVGVTNYEEDLQGDWLGKQGHWVTEDVHWMYVKKPAGGDSGLMMIWFLGEEASEHVEKRDAMETKGKKDKTPTKKQKVEKPDASGGNRNGESKL
jgi:hypothetical protein